jgi:hypothetical protein
MYHLEILANEKIRELQREAEQTRLAASVSKPAPNAPQRLVATSLQWAGQRLSYWGDQLQKENERPALG